MRGPYVPIFSRYRNPRSHLDRVTVKHINLYTSTKGGVRVRVPRMQLFEDEPLMQLLFFFAPTSAAAIIKIIARGQPTASLDK